MMHRIDFTVAWLLLIPGDAAHRNQASYLIGTYRASPWQAWLILAKALQDASHRADADALQLLQQLGGDRHLAMSSQMLRHPHQIRPKPFRTRVVEALRDDVDRRVDLSSVGTPPLPATRPAVT
jgi:hypothetical protein